MTFLKFVAIYVSLITLRFIRSSAWAPSTVPTSPSPSRLLFRFDFSAGLVPLIISFCSSPGHVSLRLSLFPGRWILQRVSLAFYFALSPCPSVRPSVLAQTSGRIVLLFPRPLSYRPFFLLQPGGTARRRAPLSRCCKALAYLPESFLSNDKFNSEILRFVCEFVCFTKNQSNLQQIYCFISLKDLNKDYQLIILTILIR